MSLASKELHGILARFETRDALVSAIAQARAAGYRELDAYCPFPDEKVLEAIEMKGDNVALVTLLGGVLGGVFGYFMQWYANVVDYPIVVASRPMDSWPSFIVPTFELTILGAALSGTFAMFIQNRLPRLFHPVFLSEIFSARGSTDAFFLCIRANDPAFDLDKTQELLRSLHCVSLDEVPLEEEPLEERPPEEGGDS